MEGQEEKDDSPSFSIHLLSCTSKRDYQWELYIDWIILVVLACVVRSSGSVGMKSEETSRLGLPTANVVLHRCCSVASCQQVASTEVRNNSLVLVNEHNNLPKLNISAFAAGLREGLNVGLLHLNHEQPWAGPDDALNFHPLPDLRAVYSDDRWSYVIRNYFYTYIQDELNGPGGKGQDDEEEGGKDADGSKRNAAHLQLSSSSSSCSAVPPPPPLVYYLPLGPSYMSLYRTADMQQSAKRASSSRRLLCYFAGQTRADRWHLAEVIRRNNLPCRYVETPPRGGQERQPYMAAMLETVFALAPAGNNPETFRFWEALELGAIPVSVRPPQDRDFFTALASFSRSPPPSSSTAAPVANPLPCPLPVLDSWEDLPAFLAAMSSSPTLLDSLQREVMEWYAAIKARIGADVASLVVEGRGAHTQRGTC